MALDRAQKAEQAKQRKLNEALAKGTVEYVLVCNDNRVLIRANTQREARDKFAMTFTLKYRKPPADHEVSVRVATDADRADFKRTRGRRGLLESNGALFDLSTIPTKAPLGNRGDHA